MRLFLLSLMTFASLARAEHFDGLPEVEVIRKPPREVEVDPEFVPTYSTQFEKIARRFPVIKTWNIDAQSSAPDIQRKKYWARDQIELRDRRIGIDLRNIAVETTLAEKTADPETRARIYARIQQINLAVGKNRQEREALLYGYEGLEEMNTLRLRIPNEE